MALKTELLRERLREVFGTESQEVIAQNLNMSQGNISKMLSGNQQPTLETVFHIAEKYNISVDWLLGLSENMTLTAQNKKDTYASVIESICKLYDYETIEVDIDSAPLSVSILVQDPMLAHLLEKCQKLSDADSELLQKWLETKLSRFYNLPLLPLNAWLNSDARRLADDATSDQEWVKVHEKVTDLACAESDFMSKYLKKD